MYIVRLSTEVVGIMKHPKLTRLELQVMEALWSRGACSIREIHETFPEKNRPAYTTIQTTVYRMEGKGALRCTKRISNANIFEAQISRNEAENRLILDVRNAVQAAIDAAKSGS